MAFALLPRYYQGELVTAYALALAAFRSCHTSLTSIVFMITRAMADAVRVFATAIPVCIDHRGCHPARRRHARVDRDSRHSYVIYHYHARHEGRGVDRDLAGIGLLLGGMSAIIPSESTGVDGGWSTILARRARKESQTARFLPGLDRAHTVFAD